MPRGKGEGAGAQNLLPEEGLSFPLRGCWVKSY